MSTGDSVSFGIDRDSGEFVRKYRDDILDDQVARGHEVLGSNADLSQGSPMKQILDVGVLEHELVWETMEDTYYAAYYPDARGPQLDKILALAGVQRKPRRGATCYLTFGVQIANTDDTVIPRGTRVSTQAVDDKPSIPFKTTRSAILPAGAAQVENVPARALEPWETDVSVKWLGKHTNVAAGTITNLDNPVAGIDTVTNPYPAGDSGLGYSFIRGRDRETDPELRQRWEHTRGEEGSATLNNIRANLLSIPEVTACKIEENTSGEDNTDGHLADVPNIPDNSFRATMVHDSVPNKIAQTIADTRSAGIQSYGPVSGTATTDDGISREESFDEATEVRIFVDVSADVEDPFPDDVAKRIETEIIEYIGGQDASFTQHNGTAMEKDAIYDLVHSRAMGVEGVWRADVRMGTTANPTGTTDITIGEFEVATTDTTAVSVSYTEQTRP